ncbi:hypothetical protein [Algoriphagus confluentis]|uniref:DUF4251 domain-containing protein n=1 Tax=Algoriphagus confluentis TaxID=1697556 RepID=A0ABQ6PTS1_9BACT|nr:hypothetical protein Aconfl_33180 [Algoriphagus confluentis]
MIKFKFLLVLLGLSFALTSCDTEDQKPKIDENGLTPEINRLVSQENLDALMDLGLDINGGGNPPQLNGEFLISPCYIAKSTAGDVEGAATRDIEMSLLNQKGFSITVDLKQQTQVANSVGSFIVGNEDRFTIFVVVEELNTSSGSKAKLLYTISGQKVSGGIANIKIANLMLDNYGNPGNIWIGNGKGRLFRDRDNLSGLVNF